MTNIITDIEEYVKTNYGSIGPTKMSLELGWSMSKLYRYVKSRNMLMTHEQKSLKKANELSKLPENFSVNHLRFENVDCEETAYILGFLWADGGIYNSGRRYSIRCSIVKCDAENIIPSFQKIGLWRIYEGKKSSKNPTWKPQITIYTNNKNLYDYLFCMGYKSKNGSPIKIIQSIPEKYRRYWWRGYFDGDGCITESNKRPQLVFAGPHDQDWTFVDSLIESIGITKYSTRSFVSKKGHKSGYCRMCRKSDITKFFDYIYQNRQNDNIGLVRKFEKYSKINHNCI